MAIKKSQLYSTIWKGCDELRGGMDASQYKDYVLVVLFMKYISDKAKVDSDSLIELPEGCTFDDLVAAKNKSNVGEVFNKILEAVADANPELRNVITNADFCDEQKLGKGKDLVEKVSNLIGVFQNSHLDFSSNREADDDIIGDAYEYLMKNFASQSGKSKGQFYTPAEVSRLIAKVIGIHKDERRQISIYDPTCGSGSLLLRAKAEARHGVSLNGQESDLSTVGMAKMNMIIHGDQTADIRHGDTINNPLHYEVRDSKLQQFDYVVANPPFSKKSWLGTAGAEDKYKRWGNEIGIGVPPEKCGDYAFLLHIIKSINSDGGKGACILPHGVLFRGNAEAEIREYIVRHHYIKGIIGLPSNLFFGTGIPACIIVLDKSDTVGSKGIFMINANEGCAKDGAKNRLREQDIKRIVDVWEAQQDVPHYARFVAYDEIERNDFNLNLPRYVEAEDKEIVQDIDAHLHGGIPAHDVGQMQDIWNACPTLRNALFTPEREGYYTLIPKTADIRTTVAEEPSFKAQYADFNRAIDVWKEHTAKKLGAIAYDSFNPKDLIDEISQPLLAAVNASPCLVNGYDAYDQLMNYWGDTMQDDCYLIADQGWKAELQLPLDKKGAVKKTYDYTALQCDLLPVDIVIDEFFDTEKTTINKLAAHVEELDNEISQIVEEHEDDFSGYDKEAEVRLAYRAACCRKPLAGEKEILEELLDMPASPKAAKELRNAFIAEHDEIFDGWEKTGKGEVKARLKEIEIYAPLMDETKAVFKLYLDKNDKLKEVKSELKEIVMALTKAVIEKYAALTEGEIKQLVIERKWMYAITNHLLEEMTTLTQQITSRISTVANRYAETLSCTTQKVSEIESRVLGSLKEMGFTL